MGRHWAQSILVFPRETHFLPLDGETAARPASTDLVLWSYRDVVALPLMTSDALRMSEEAMSVALGHLKSALRAQRQREPIEVSNNLELAARALDGAPIDSFEPITSLLGFEAFEHVARGSIEWARAVTQLGLALLPDHPILLGILGELELREGKTEQGRLTLGRALERDAGLDERMRARIESLIGPSTA